MSAPIRYMTTEEVAAHYRVGAETVRRWRRDETGPADLPQPIKVGRRWLYSLADLLRAGSPATVA